MSGRRKYHRVKPGEWFRPAMREHREKCCDCGLVHIIDFRIADGRVEKRIFRDQRSTAAGRRKRRGRR